MTVLIPADGLQHHSNTHVRKGTMGPRQHAVLSPEAHNSAYSEIRQWPGYAPTPLRDLAGLAETANLSKIWYKDEAGRFGLGSFKALGGAYAVMRLLKKELSDKGITANTEDILNGKYAEQIQNITVSCATDGNHGRSVAWGAQRFGCQCVIFIHKTVSIGRAEAIAKYGAEVIRVDGNYDDSVREAAKQASEKGWFVISDTSYPGYMEVPRDVMQGYTVMVAEALAEIPKDTPPTHVFVQGGVGGLAAAVAAQVWDTYGKKRPRLILSEPEDAACLFESAKAGKPVIVPGELDTIMAGLACGEVSLLAWEILDEAIDDFLVIPDSAAITMMQHLAKGINGDKGFVAGESAVAGLAGCLSALNIPEIAEKMELGPNSRILIFGSEGATDPEMYTKLVGRKPEDVSQ